MIVHFCNLLLLRLGNNMYHLLPIAYLTNCRRMLVTLVVSKAAFLYSRLMKTYCAIITLSFFRKELIA